jgi:hypothetical protein
MACWADHVDHPQDRYFDTLYAVFEDLAASWFRKQKIPRLDLVRTGRISGEQLRQAGVSPRIYRSLIGKLNEELHRKIS